jgi:flavin reductase (DIM6/NTAB) family NADH-FMN oxidoreductase RutF
MHYLNCEEGQFRAACSKFPSGVAVMTTIAPNSAPQGITVSSFTTVSFSPPLVLACIGYASPMVEYVQYNKYCAFNILKDNQRNLSLQFAGNWRKRFETVEWHRGKTGAPLLTDVLASFECRLTEVVPAGDHVITIASVLDAKFSDELPLVYVNRTYAGIQIKKAPSIDELSKFSVESK